MKAPQLTVADLYCGPGGLSAGFVNARASWLHNHNEQFQIAYGLDKDPDAVATFNRYHARTNGAQTKVAECRPVSEVSGKSILAYAEVDAIDVLIGGPNCQGVSAAGLRNPKDRRNEMFRRFVELVQELRPQWFVMENVPGLTHANNRGLLRTIFEELSAIPGYRVEADVLLAAHFEVPQFRHRIFFVGTRTNAPIRFPTAQITDPAQFRTVRQAIGTLRDTLRDEDGKSSNHWWVDLGDENLRRIKSIRPGEDWRDMPIRLLPERFFATRASDQKGTYGRLEWEWPAYTITSSVSNVTAGPFTHPEHHRPLSVREAARLQSFDDEHILVGPIDSQYRQVGNAVPPRLARAVAEAILFCHFCPQEAEHQGQSGRITPQLLADEAKGKAVFPTLTPRSPRRFPKRTRKQVNVREKADEGFMPLPVAWRKEKRPSIPHKEDVETLRRLAAQPGNYRAAKRARVILGYFEGKSQQSILKRAKVSKSSIEKWIAGFVSSGLEGWRAYHTPLNRVLKDDPTLIYKIKAATSQVRTAGSEIRLAQNGNKRLHMNDFLLRLKERFGKHSTRELIRKVERELGSGIGTVYVGDLLAMAAVVLRDRPL
jgi:DNA (cytosine-5)-methyltransferase 1